MSGSIPTSDSPCAPLGRALEALRLNLSFPSWQAIRAHLDAIALRPRGEPAVPVCPRTGWPLPAEWRRVRADHRLASGMLARWAPIAAAGDPVGRERVAWFEAMARATPLPEGGLDVALVRREPDGVRLQVVLDRLDLSGPSFVRWSLRLLDRGAGRFTADELQSRATEAFGARLAALTGQSVPEALVLLEADPDLDVEEVIRGEIGPALPSPAGPRLSALLSRADATLGRVTVDDPLQDLLLVPRPEAGFGYSSHRKWAVPRAALDAHRTWLTSLGSRNLTYGYDP